MRHEILGNPDYGQLTVSLDPGEKFLAEGGAMSWMSDGMEVKARLLGGFFKSLFRKLFGGESLFVGEYTHASGGEVTLSPTSPGTVLQRALNGDSLILTAGSFLACSPDVQLATRFAGLKAIFSGEGMFFIECRGQGDLFFNSFGAIVEKNVQGSFIVDTSHVVAWEPSLDYKIRGMGNLKSTFFSGEGLVMQFHGSGTVYLQTRTLGSLAGWITPFLA